jgi:4-hydroxy 2-oxovalerate aldolase
MNQDHRLQILDCTLRDGGYVNHWRFDLKVARETYRALSSSGVDYVELGFRASRDRFDPAVYGPWRTTTEQSLRSATEGIEGPKIALMGNYGEIELDELEDGADSVAAMVRVAAHRSKVFEALDLLEKIKHKGYVTSLQAMAFTGYSKGEKADLLKAVGDAGLDYFYIADTYGSMVPNELKVHFEPFLELGTVRVGFHPHNNLQLAFANTLEAVRLGVDIVDCTLYGMGRGAGNLPTEALLAYLSTQGDERYNVVPILNCIDRYYVALRRQHPWGYQLPYMISGMFRCHPNYASELVKRKEYSIEDIWKALEVVDELKPVGFDPSLVETLIRRGVLGSLGKKAMHVVGERPEAPRDAKPVPYVNRHAGRDFLILANGPGLKQYHGRIQAFIEAYDPVCLGANNLGGLFEPTYHAFTNKHRFVMYLDTVNPRSKLLIGENIPGHMISQYVRRDHETLFFEDLLDADFDIAGGRIQTNCRTVSVLLLGVAIVMGARRLFVAGMDGYLGKDRVTKALFYDEKIEPEDYDLIVERHRWNERFLVQIDQYVRDKGREGVHILTPTSHQRFYKSIENYLQPVAPVCTVAPVCNR